MNITLRAGERIYINGAVLRIDRKATIELLNDATFLLETHVMQASDATTPLRQIYFVVQVMLMDPAAAKATTQLARGADRQGARRLRDAGDQGRAAGHRRLIGRVALFRGDEGAAGAVSARAARNVPGRRSRALPRRLRGKTMTVSSVILGR